MDEGDGPDPDLIRRLRAAVQACAPVGLAVVFGSSVGGRTRHDSDVDVAIVPHESGLDDTSELALWRELTRAAGREVDLIRTDRAPTLLKWEIATKGVALVESSPGEFARFQARAAAEYIDFAPALVHYGEIFRRRLLEQGRAR